MRTSVYLASLATVSLACASAGHAQSFETLHTFPGDGTGHPRALLLSGNTIYGTDSAAGEVFALNTDGTGFKILYSFTPRSGPGYTNTDGAFPNGLVLSGNTLYGAAQLGGLFDSGTIFAINTDGTGFTNLYNFTGRSDGDEPMAGVILLNNTLYGTTWGGGDSGVGSVFALSTDGASFIRLYSFSGSTDGAFPNGLVLSNGGLYGTSRTSSDGSSWGAVFVVNTDGTGFTILYSFTVPLGGSCCYTNSDGIFPRAGLIASGDTLYGTASAGGDSASGTIFKVKKDGTDFTTLHSFAYDKGGQILVTNIDGAAPFANLILAGNTLYGTARYGGGGGIGTVFSINTNGNDFQVLHSFSALSDTTFTNNDGAEPLSLILSDSTLYGTTVSGGTLGGGTLFKISLPRPAPQLTIISDSSGGFLINAQGSPNFTCQLQRAPTLTGPWSTSASQTADTNGLIQFHDLFPPPDRAFYRTLQQ